MSLWFSVMVFVNKWYVSFVLDNNGLVTISELVEIFTDLSKFDKDNYVGDGIGNWLNGRSSYVLFRW